MSKSNKISPEQRKKLIARFSEEQDSVYNEYKFIASGIKGRVGTLGAIDTNGESKETKFLIQKLREMDKLLVKYYAYDAELTKLYSE